MIITLYFHALDVEKLKNFEPVQGYSWSEAGHCYKMEIDITKVKVSYDKSNRVLTIQRYSPSETTGPK